jgi:hypothetical protein
MKLLKTGLTILITFLVCSFSKAQDTLAYFYESLLTDEDKIFAKQGKDSSTFYLIAINNQRVVAKKINILTKETTTKEEKFDKENRTIWNFYSTDSSFVLIVSYDNKQFNCMRYEYQFSNDTFLNKKVYIAPLTENKTLAYSTENESMLFYQYDKEKESYIFTKYKGLNQTFSISFETKTIVASTQIKEKDFKKYFANTSIPLVKENDMNLISVASSSKCYIKENVAYLLSSEYKEGKISIISFNLTTKLIEHKELSYTKVVCKQKKYFPSCTYSIIDKYILVSANCSQNAEIQIFQLQNLQFLKSYSTNETFVNAAQNLESYYIQYKKNEKQLYHQDRNTIFEETINDPYPIPYLTTYSVGNDSFAIVSGVFKLKEPSFGAFLLSAAVSILSYHFFHLDIGYIRYFLSPNPYLFDGNYKRISNTKYAVRVFNLSNLNAFDEPIKKSLDNQVSLINSDRVASASFLFNKFTCSIFVIDNDEFSKKVLITKAN